MAHQSWHLAPDGTPNPRSLGTVSPRRCRAVRRTCLFVCCTYALLWFAICVTTYVLVCLHTLCTGVVPHFVAWSTIPAPAALLLARDRRGDQPTIYRYYTAYTLVCIHYYTAWLMVARSHGLRSAMVRHTLQLSSAHISAELRTARELLSWWEILQVSLARIVKAPQTRSYVNKQAPQSCELYCRVHFACRAWRSRSLSARSLAALFVDTTAAT